MKRALFVLLFAVAALFVLAGCTNDSNSGVSSEVPAGKVVTLTLALRDQVQINIEGNSISYYVGKEAGYAFPEGMFWVRMNGDVIDLQTAVRNAGASIKGTWFITKNDKCKTVLFVYADATKVPKTSNADQTNTCK